MMRINLVLSVVFIILLNFVVKNGAINICDSCFCLEIDDDILIIKCKGNAENQTAPNINKTDFNFEEMGWPTSERFFKVYFNHFGLFVLPKIPGDSRVISLNFDDNSIRSFAGSNPFEPFNNLKQLSISNNLLTILPIDFFKSCRNLEELKLTNNTIREIQPKVLEPLKNLREIDLSFNEISQLTGSLTESLSHVKVLNFQANRIFSLEPTSQKQFKWKQLILAHNQLKVLTSSNIDKFQFLQSVDLSNNQLTNIDDATFSNLTFLKHLQLSNNHLQNLKLHLPETLESLSIGHNNLHELPFKRSPLSLLELEIEFNQIAELNFIESQLDNLKLLNVSNNHLEILPNTKTSHLEILDLSSNFLKSFPPALSQRAPLLKVLILDANPIEIIEIADQVTLEKLSLRNLQQLETITAHAFKNVEGIKIRSDNGGYCFDLLISNCSKLSAIHETAFGNLIFCQLDLSNNNLTMLPQNLTDWSAIEDGLNIQGNPFECYCDAQWMLDIIVTELYKTRHGRFQYLLGELRCHYPEHLKGHRFVRYYEHKNAFCRHKSERMMVQPTEGRTLFGGIFNPSDDNEVDDKVIVIQLSKGPGFIIIIVLSALILIGMIAIGIHWTRQQNRRLRMRRNRLYNDY